MVNQVISTFMSLDRFDIPNRGIVFVVKNDTETEDFSHLINRLVIVDGTRYTCIGVERHCHSRPWRKGEQIGILVNDIKE